MSCVVHVVNVTVICLYCEYICMYRSLDWTYCWITDYTSFPYWFYILFLHSFICTSLHIYIGYYSCHIIDHSFACHVIIVRLSISISLSILLSQMYSIFLSLGWEHLLHLMSVRPCIPNPLIWAITLKAYRNLLYATNQSERSWCSHNYAEVSVTFNG